jgi:hypothetical protein
MLELAALEAKHLEQRRNVDGKLIRVQQSKAFFMEEVAQAARRQAEAQVTALSVPSSLAARAYSKSSRPCSCFHRFRCLLADATVLCV